MQNQVWPRVSDGLFAQWEQCVLEGKDVEKYRTLCMEAEKNGGEETAHGIYNLLEAAPVLPGFPFTEPSGLEGIKCERPQKTCLKQVTADEAELLSKIKGAWLGRTAGCLLGKPIEGSMRKDIAELLKATDNFPMKGYIYKSKFTPELIEKLKLNMKRCWADSIGGVSPIDDDTNYTVLGLKIIEKYGVDFTPSDVLSAWLAWMPLDCTFTAERVAYRNAAMGIEPPLTATYFNPYREWIGAQIRADFFGYIYPGNPRAAAELAFKDASVSHVKNGIYGEMFTSALIAACAACKSIKEAIDAALCEIPQKCRLRRDVEQVMQWYEKGMTSDEITDKIHLLYDEYSRTGWCYTNPNTMIVVMALLCGNKDFGKTICLAVQAAFDTDCNGATAGSALGIMLGEKGIDPVWTNVFNGKLQTAILGYETADINELAEKTVKLIR